MNERIHAFASSALAVVLLALLAACGGSADELAASADAARGGKTGGSPTVPASIAVTPALASLGQDVTISFYPASYADGRLFLNWICYQNGAQVSHDGTYELHEAVSLGIPGYADLGDHFDWRFTFEPLQSYTGGAATCEVIGWYVNRKSEWIKIAGGSFEAQ
jgi:hypothetical protein